MNGNAGSVAAAVLCVGILAGCRDGQPPTWTPQAALSAESIEAKAVVLAWSEAADDDEVALYRVFRGEVAVATVDAANERRARVEGLAEFSDYTFYLVAEDEAGNGSMPLELTVKTADVTPPVFEEGCVLKVDVVEPGDLSRGMELSWCAATDNDRLDHYSLRRYGDEIARSVETSHVRKDTPLDGTYTLHACDPGGNCAALGPVSFSEERRLANEKVIAELLGSSSLLAALNDTSGVFGGLSEEEIWGDMELEGIGGLVAVDSWGTGGLGALGTGSGGGGTGEGLGGLGSGYGGGGGGGAVGIGGLGTRGRGSSYTPPSVSFDGGKPDALAAHVQRRLSRIERCYTTSEGERAAGTLSIALSADEEGSITVGSVTGVSDETLLRCATNALRGRLAEAPGEKLSGTFKITLDPGSR